MDHTLTRVSSAWSKDRSSVQTRGHPAMRPYLWPLLALLVLAVLIDTTSGSAREYVPGVTKSIVTSSFSIRRFAGLNITNNIKKYIEHEEFRLRIITNFTGHEEEVPFVKKRLTEFKKIHKGLIKNGTKTAKFTASLKQSHPTTVLVALRNFLATWEDKLANTTVYGKRLREFLEANDTKPLPTRHDLKTIQLALSLLQATYNLSMTDLLKGQVLGVKGEPLSNADCYDIGKRALSIGLLEAAYEWLEAAVSGHDLDKINVSALTFNISDALASMARIDFKRKDQAKALKLYEKAYDLDPDNQILYQEYVKHRFGRDVGTLSELDRDSVEPWRKKFYDMCKNSTNVTWLAEERSSQKNLKCRLRVSRTVPYLFYKEEILSKSPFISLILDFLSPREVKNLRNATQSQLKEATLPGFAPHILWHFRAGYFRDTYDENVRGLSDRAGELTGLDVNQSHDLQFLGEPIHVIDFGIGGLELPCSDLNLKYGPQYNGFPYGNRFATLHIFLNNVTAGGATVFIEQNITIIPKQGNAVLWINYKPSGEPETNLFSGTCPLAVGQNIVVQKGIWRKPEDRWAVCGRRQKSTHLTADKIQSCHPALCTQV